MRYLTLREEIDGRIKSEPIFFGERTLISFGRSREADYRLLPTRSAEENKYMSRIQATVERNGDRIIVRRGSQVLDTGEIQRATIYVDYNPVEADFLELDIGDEIHLYRDLRASVSIKVMDESVQASLSSCSSDPGSRSPEGATQPFDLMEMLLAKVTKTEDTITLLFPMIEALSNADREVRGEVRAEARRSRQWQRFTLAVFLAIAFGGGAQLIQTDAGKDHYYRIFELIVVLSSSLGAGSQIKDLLKK